MLPLAISLLILGLITATLAIRGRVVARGRFCRKCRFDLAGIDAQTCPECGRDVTAPDATRAILRSPSRAGILAAVVLLLAGALIAAAPLARGPGFFAKLPDAQILLLNRLGVDGALTELAARTTGADPLSEAHWQAAIARGLDHQADTATPWDPRWGQVLAHAFIQQRMSEEQIRDYLEHGFTAEVTIRDRIAQGADRAGFWINWTQGRISTSGPSIRTGVTYDQTLTRSGVVGGDTPERDGDGGGSRGELIIQGAGFGGSNGMGSGVVIPASARTGESVRVYVETRFVLNGADGQPAITLDPARHEQTVRVLPPGEPVVGLVADPAAAEIVRAGATVTPLMIAIPEPEQNSRWGVNAGQMQISFGDRPHAVAGRLYALTDSGEIEIGTIKLPAGEGQHAHGLGWYINVSQLDEHLPRLRAVAANETVDMVFRTEPDAAADDPRIDRVVDMTLVFKDVPVRVVADPKDVYDVSSVSNRIPAAPTADGAEP